MAHDGLRTVRVIWGVHPRRQFSPFGKARGIEIERMKLQTDFEQISRP